MMDTTRSPGQLTPARAEDAYNRLTGYRFAQRYVEGKSVADIGSEDLGYGTRLLAGTAESVTGLTSSPEALKLAQTFYSGPNTRYRWVNLPELPYPEDRFDVVVAFEVIETLEQPENLVREAKRVLKEGGVFLVSTPDKQVYSNDRNHRDPNHARELYASELREMLERNFGWVDMYRQEAVAGGLIFKDAEGLPGASVESTRFTLTDPSFGAGPPKAGLIMAVCGDSEAPEEGDRRPYLLLDQDRRVFDECEDHREDVGLLKDEIQRMQETEVQAFQDTLRVRNTELAFLRSRLEWAEARAQRLQKHIRDTENSRSWRVLSLLRRSRAVVNSLRKP